MPTAIAGIPRQTHVYKTHKEGALEADVLGAEPGKSKSCVLWIHGGGLIFGSRKMSPRATFAQAMLDHDIVVVSIDHRLAPEAKLPAIVEDVNDAWHWLHDYGRELLGIDPTRTAIAGASAGGYLALLAGYMFEPRPRALASFWGYGDIMASWEAEPSDYYRTMELVTREQAVAGLRAQFDPGDPTQSERSLFYLYCRQQGQWLQEVTAHDLKKDSAWLERYCPTRNIGPTFPPTILIHGTQDSDVPHEESQKLAERLASFGVTYRFVSLPGVGHGFAGAELEAAQAVEIAVAEFLTKELQ